MKLIRLQEVDAYGNDIGYILINIEKIIKAKNVNTHYEVYFNLKFNGIVNISLESFNEFLDKTI